MPTPPDFTAGTALAAASLNKIGLWEVGSIAFTGQTGANLDSVFTADFRNYLIVADVTTSGAETLVYQLRAGGVTNTGLNTDSLQTYMIWGSTALYANQLTSQNYAYFGYSNTNGSGVVLTLWGPQLAKYTYSTNENSLADYRTTSWSKHAVNTQYDGIRIASFGTATITGKVMVYGYGN